MNDVVKKEILKLLMLALFILLPTVSGKSCARSP
ncbi:unnamed protein product [Rhodiola kirilowii]